MCGFRFPQPCQFSESTAIRDACTNGRKKCKTVGFRLSCSHAFLCTRDKCNRYKLSLGLFELAVDYFFRKIQNQRLASIGQKNHSVFVHGGYFCMNSDYKCKPSQPRICVYTLRSGHVIPELGCSEWLWVRNPNT